MNNLQDSLSFDELLPLNYEDNQHPEDTKPSEDQAASGAHPIAAHPSAAPVSDTCYRLELLSGAAAATDEAVPQVE